MPRQFLKFIAIMQVITIVMVVLGHSFHEYPDGNMGKTLLLYRMLYSFRMPLFMFVSGLLMAYTSEKPLSQQPKNYIGGFARSKIERLMIPFVTLIAVTFVPRSLSSSIADDAVEFGWKAFADSFLYPDSLTIPYFWFLQSSFTLLIVCFLWLAFTSRLRVNRLASDVALLTVAAVVMVVAPFPAIFALSETARLGVYFVLGIIYCHNMARVDRLIPWTSPLFLIITAAVWAGLFFLTEGSPWIAVCSVTGIAMIISVAKIIEARGWGALDHLIGANYMIFLLSWFFNVATQQVLRHFLTMPWYVYTVLSLVAGIYVPWLCYRLMLRHPRSRGVRIAAFLLGQKIKNQ